MDNASHRLFCVWDSPIARSLALLSFIAILSPHGDRVARPHECLSFFR
ncbi:MAG: hypothetical protein AB4290_05685 [Spirulina sp.]